MRPVNLILFGLALGGFIRPSHTAWAQAPAPSGTVITIAGNGVGGFSGDGGPALNASISGPYGSAIGPDGTLYFADSNNFRIRAVDPATGIITTLAALDAELSAVVGIAVDRARNSLYIGDFGQNWVSKVDLSTSLLSRYAGTGTIGFSGDGGPATSASLGFPYGVATDAAGNLFFSDVINFRIRRVDPVTGIITTIAGNGDNVSAGDGGPATAASFGPSLSPLVAADSAGNVFVVDEDAGANKVIRRIDAITGIITTIAGGGATTPGTGTATDMDLGPAYGLAVDDDGTLFVGSGNQVFRVDLGTGQLSPFAGAAVSGFSGDGGPALDARFFTIFGLTVAPGGGLIISDTQNERIRYVAPESINLSGDSGQTEFYLPWVSALSGDLIITNNPNLSVINASALVTVAGDLEISGNTSATAINASALVTVAGDLNVSGNILAGDLDLSSVISTGDLTITGNTSTEAINASALVTVAGDLEISGNTSATAINASALVTVAGDLNVSGNILAGDLDLSSVISTGDLTITGNTSTEAINASALVTVAGDLEISGNGLATTVNVAPNIIVSGDVTIETAGNGTFDVSGADVEGNTSLTTDGYTEVDAATAGGQTAVTMLNSAATMEVTLPDGAFSSANPVTFSIEKLPGSVETIGDDTITHLETYSFDFAIPTLNSAAELNFEIDLAVMDEPERLSLLGLLHDGALLTLGVLGDAPGSELQLFDVCAPGAGPVADACVVVEWLDENRMLLDPLAGIDPSILRLEGLVGHFSTYSFVAVTPAPAADFDEDGDVDSADLAQWQGDFGENALSDADNDGDSDGADFLTWQQQFGRPALAVSANAPVPEPATFLLFIVATAGIRRPAVRRAQELINE